MATAFVLASYSENFGIAAVEALAAGLPCIVSEDVALSHEIAAAQAGVIAGTDPTSIAAAILATLDSRSGYECRWPPAIWPRAGSRWKRWVLAWRHFTVASPRPKPNAGRRLSRSYGSLPKWRTRSVAESLSMPTPSVGNDRMQVRAHGRPAEQFARLCRIGDQY
jgi:glycosyltransferase involved in cell wall biosynthesis